MVEELLRSGNKLLAAAANAGLVGDGETSAQRDSKVETLVAHGGVVGGHKLTTTGSTSKNSTGLGVMEKLGNIHELLRNCSAVEGGLGSLDRLTSKEFLRRLDVLEALCFQGLGFVS